MTPQGAVFVSILLVVLVLAFFYDKKKADKIRAEIDQKFDGKHVCDFKSMYYSGYIADNTLVLKERVRGYLLIDLTKVTKICSSTVHINGVPMTNIWFYGEDGKTVGDSNKIKQMSPRAANKLINLIIEHVDGIVWN